MEIGAGYGHELPFAPGLFIGGDLKLMRAKVGYASYFILQNSDNQSNIISNPEARRRRAAAISAWTPGRYGTSTRPSRRVVGASRRRHRTQPGITRSSLSPRPPADGVTGKYAVNPQARMGLSISPFHWWNIAADLDMTRNLTPIDGLASRQLGLGTEVGVFNRSWINIPLRFGVGLATSRRTATC